MPRGQKTKQKKTKKTKKIFSLQRVDSAGKIGFLKC